MATDYITSMKQAYAEQILKNGDEDRAEEIVMGNVYSPILKVREAHDDSEPSPKDFNEMVSDLVYDLSILNVKLCSTGYLFKDLLEDTITRLDTVKNTIKAEKERQDDINMLCNKYTEFSDIVDLSFSDFSGTFSENDGVFSAQIQKQTEIELEVTAVEGNGYEGNTYVYKDGAFLEDTISTADRGHMTDGLDIPYYEYSRITASSTENEIFSLVNTDSIAAKCNITLHSDTKFNKLIIKSPQADITLSDVLTSNDGIIFKSVLESSIELNNTDKKYEITNYVPGSGIVCFSSTNYVRITLESNEATDDVIAFYKTVIVE